MDIHAHAQCAELECTQTASSLVILLHWALRLSLLTHVELPLCQARTGSIAIGYLYVFTT